MLGLIAPGGGFILWAGGDAGSASLHFALALGSVGAVAAGLLAWFATGAILAPFLIWVLTAALATLMAPAHVGHDLRPNAEFLVPASVAAGWAAALGASVLSARAGARRRDERNRAIAIAAPPPAWPAPREERLQELSADELELMRFVLDRALQPLDAFEGFELVDQFQTAALRYQINMLAYALSMTQYVRLPAFQGYLTQAQQNLAEKQQDHRVWRYWRLENLWGNFRTSADPVPRDNIMYTGFLAMQLACFHAASGRRTYDAPGSLLLRHPNGGTFAYDLPGLAEVLTRQWSDSPFGLIACEPNWIYPLCNSIGAAGVRIHDNLTGGRRWAKAEASFLRGLEDEMLTPAGEFVPCRSSRFGFALPQVGGAVGQAFPCFFLNAASPRIARRHWLGLRAGLAGEDFRRRLWPVDVGNYRFSRASSYAATAAAARELGDEVIAQWLLDALDKDCPRTRDAGVAHRPRASVWAHGAELLARTGRADALRDMANAQPRAALSEPHIEEAPYPAVLVAGARSSDGELRAVLRPGLRAGPQHVGFAGLRPGAVYRLSGDLVGLLMADSMGRASIRLLIEDRTEFRLRPAM